MTPQELKNSILQLAIQGKLVEQRPEEGTAEVLYRQIQAEKQALIKTGNNKKEKPQSEITEDEKPFDLPENWLWVRLDDLVVKEIKRGKSPTYTPKSNTLVFAQKCNTKAGYIDLSLSLFLDEAKLSKYPESEFMRDRDIVINSTGNGTLGRVGIYRDSDNPRHMPIVPDSHVTVIRVSSAVSTEYVFYGLKYYQPYMEKLGSGSTNQTELSANTVKDLLFPLPPLAEQKRIAARIEELLPLIDRYEKAWARLEDFNKRFPGDMQKSLLQMAIQGKLVEQRVEEGTGEELYQQIQREKQSLIKTGKIKKEKPLPEITEDEIPFEIPESWKWVKLGDIAKVQPSNGFSPKGVDYETPYKKLTLTATTSGYFKPDAFKYVDISSEVAERYFLEDGDILIQRSNSRELVGTACLCRCGPEKFIYPDLMMRLHLLDNIDVDYVVIALKAPFCRSYYQQAASGTSESMPKINQGTVRNTLVPLPPLAEQKRIVARLEELLSLCARLK